MYRIPVASFLAAALLFTMVNLKAAPPESVGPDFVSAEHGAKMDFAKRADRHRAGRSQRAGGERAGVVRHRKHR